MSIFSLKGILSLDGSKWRGSLEAAQRHTKQFAKTFSIGIGSILKAHLVSAITDAFRDGYNQVMKSLDRAANIRDKATRIGVTPERMQALDYAARQSGATGEQVVAAVKGLSKTLQRAREMTVDPATGKSVRKDQAIFDTFRKFMLTTKQIDELPAAAIFQAIAENVRLGANQQNRSADLQKLMEEAGDALVPMMLANLPKTMAEAKSRGVVASSRGIMTAAGLSDYRTQEQEIEFARSIEAGSYSEDLVKKLIAANSFYNQTAIKLATGAADQINKFERQGIFTTSIPADLLGISYVGDKAHEIRRAVT